MSFLIQPLLDLTVPVYNMARSNGNTSHEMAKLIQSVSRIGLAIGLYAAYRMIASRIQNPENKNLAIVPVLAFTFVHPYSTCLACAPAFYKIAISEREIYSKTFFALISVAFLHSASSWKNHLHRYPLDRAIVNFSNTLTSRS